MFARFADALGIGRFDVVGTSGGGRYAYACAVALADRVTGVALVGSTAPANLPVSPRPGARLIGACIPPARTAPWMLRVLLATTVRRFRRQPDRMLGMFPVMSASDEQAVARPDIQAMVTRMTAYAFGQGSRASRARRTTRTRPWRDRLDPPAVPVDVWHVRDDIIVRHEQARILEASIPAARLHLLDGEGHLSLVMQHSARYLEQIVMPRTTPPSTRRWRGSPATAPNPGTKSAKNQPAATGGRHALRWSSSA